MQFSQMFTELKGAWFIILFIGAMVVQWTNINNRISTIELQLIEQYPVYLEIQKDIVYIKTTLEFIKLNVTKQ